MVRPNRGMQTELRRRCSPTDSTLHILTANPLRLDADLTVGEEYIHCTGFDIDAVGAPTLTGCSRGLRQEDGGTEPREWLAGTTVAQVPWTTKEVVYEYPIADASMVGRDFVYDTQDGNSYSYRVIEENGEPIIKWDDEPPALPPESGDTVSALIFATYKTLPGSTAGVVIDPGLDRFMTYFTDHLRLRRYDLSGVQVWDESLGSYETSRHLAVTVTRIYVIKGLYIGVYNKTPIPVTPNPIGNGYGTGNGQVTEAWAGIAANASTVWATDKTLKRVQVFDAATGAYITKITGFNRPTGLCLSPDGAYLYVLDAGAGKIYKYSVSTGLLVATITIGTGAAEGKISTTAEGIAVGTDGNIWVADTGNHRINVYDSTGVFITAGGLVGIAVGNLKSPKQIALVSNTVAYVADWNNNRTTQVTITQTTYAPLEPVIVLPAEGDILRYRGSKWVNEVLVQRPITIAMRSAASTAAQNTWTDMLAAKTELTLGGNTGWWRVRADLSQFTQFRVGAHIIVAGASSGPRLRLEFSDDELGWNPVGTVDSDGQTPTIGVVGTRVGSYAAVRNAAKITAAYLRIVGIDGNGTADPQIGNIWVEFV